MRDYLCRILYCHILGHDVSWSYIHAVKLAQLGTQMDKKIGYLACCLLLHRDHELILLLINTVQRDLKSSNILDNMAALSAASQLVPTEMIPMLLPVVLDKLKHPREMVRQKAVMCLFQFQLLAPELLDHNHDDLQRALFDKDPGVMATAVHIVHNNIQRDPEKNKDIGESLIAILGQIISRKMATMFEYHSIPLPWLQIDILRCLAKLASVHDSIRRSLSPLLKDVLQRTNVKESMAFAILYECIVCIVAMQPERLLLEEAAQHVAKFVRSSEPNLKYIGVKALVSLVQVEKQYALDYQDLILDSLENTDPSLQRKMYKLLYQIAIKTNIELITSRLLHQLTVTLDKFWRSEVITMVINLTERFADNPQWQVETLLSVVQLGGDGIDNTVINTVISRLQTGYISGDVSQKDQYFLVQKSVSFMLMNNTEPPLVQISAWVLGELCPLLKNMPEDKVVSLFTKHLCNRDLPYSVKTCLVSALQKLLVKQVVKCVTMVTQLTECVQLQQSVVIKQRLTVLLGVCRQDMTLHNHDDGDIDTTLSFLDDHVSQHLEDGACTYTPVHLRGISSAIQRDLTDYLVPLPQDDTASSRSRLRTGSSTSSTKTMEDNEPGLKFSGVKKVWGKQGRLDTTSPGHDVEEAPFTEKKSFASEDERQQRELASALFSGLHTVKHEDTWTSDIIGAADDSGFSLGSSDTAGWRNLHSTMLQSESLAVDKQNDYDTRDAENSDITRTKDGEPFIDQKQSQINSVKKPGEKPIVESLPSQKSDLVNISKPTADNQNSILNTLTNQNESEFPSANENADISTNEELDEALSMLLSDNSSFLNISVLSNDPNVVSVSRVSQTSSAAKSSHDSACTHSDDSPLPLDTQQISMDIWDTGSNHQGVAKEDNFKDTVSETEDTPEETATGSSLYSEHFTEETLHSQCDTDLSGNNYESIYTEES